MITVDQIENKILVFDEQYGKDPETIKGKIALLAKTYKIPKDNIIIDKETLNWLYPNQKEIDKKEKKEIPPKIDDSKWLKIRKILKMK